MYLGWDHDVATTPHMFVVSLLLLLLHTALVKVLRRCVRDMASKSSGFVELCVKTEKEAAQEVGRLFILCLRSATAVQARILADQSPSVVCKLQQAPCTCVCAVCMLPATAALA
jgi:hypothetical protein